MHAEHRAVSCMHDGGTATGLGYRATGLGLGLGLEPNTLLALYVQNLTGSSYYYAQPPRAHDAAIHITHRAQISKFWSIYTVNISCLIALQKNQILQWSRTLDHLFWAPVATSV